MHVNQKRIHKIFLSDLSIITCHSITPLPMSAYVRYIYVKFDLIILQNLEKRDEKNPKGQSNS